VTLDWDPNEQKRQRERERYATMSDEKMSKINKKHRELYTIKNAPKKSAKMLQMTPKETAQSTGMVIKLISLRRKYRGAVGYLLYQ